MNAIVIRKNLPKPTKRFTGSMPARGSIYPFEDLAVGDVFLLPNREKNNMAGISGDWSKRLDRKFSSRLVWMREEEDGWNVCEKDDEGAVKGIGVWRDK